MYVCFLKKILLFSFLCSAGVDHHTARHRFQVSVVFVQLMADIFGHMLDPQRARSDIFVFPTGEPQVLADPKRSSESVGSVQNYLRHQHGQRSGNVPGKCPVRLFVGRNVCRRGTRRNVILYTC